MYTIHYFKIKKSCISYKFSLIPHCKIFEYPLFQEGRHNVLCMIYIIHIWIKFTYTFHNLLPQACWNCDKKAFRSWKKRNHERIDRKCVRPFLWRRRGVSSGHARRQRGRRRGVFSRHARQRGRGARGLLATWQVTRGWQTAGRARLQ